MGQWVSLLNPPVILRKRKLDRKECSNSSSDNSELESSTPKKKRLLTTTQYIYQALFKEEQNSDISVMTLGKIWHLHKIYLCQSPYFYSMFNGSWKEATENFVHIQIVDPKITLDALQSVFGSLYSDEIDIDPTTAIPILAAATLFQMEGIIEKCAEVMVEALSADTAIQFYEAGTEYGLERVKKSAFEWLETNLLSVYCKEDKYLKQIGIELMTALINSPDLYVLQTEFSLYQLLRNWMYLKLFPIPSDSGSDKPKPQKYFSLRKGMEPFLTSQQGQPFLKPFRALRIPYLLNHVTDLKIICEDNIFPEQFINPHIFNHWKSLLRVDHFPEKGPQKIADDKFAANCMRCGRVLLNNGYHKWRWTGFHFGLDLILTIHSGVLSIRRHHRIEQERLLSMQADRRFMIRARITSCNDHGQRVFTQSSEILSLKLVKNEEIAVMVLDPKLTYPLILAVNLLVVNIEINKSDDVTLHSSAPSQPENQHIPISEIGGSSDDIHEVQ